MGLAGRREAPGPRREAVGARRARILARARGSLAHGCGAFALGCGALALGCASGPADPGAAGPGGRPPAEILEALRAADSSASVHGSPELPVVGRFAAFRGPGDSAWVGFAASLPPSALRFAREGELFAASYQVRVAFVAGSDTVRALNRREIVRVDDFAETTRTDEAVLFQRFLTLPPGDYEVEVLVRELTTRNEVVARRSLHVPAFGGSGAATLAGPVIAWRAVARRAVEQAPPLLLAPRSTAVHGRPPAAVVVEDYAPGDGGYRLEVRVDGEVVWSDTLAADGAGTGPAGLVAALPLQRLSPGLARVRVTALADGRAAEAPLVVALADQWVFEAFEEAIDHLRYAVDAERLEEWRRAPVAERARLWEEFYRHTDPDPATAENEYLAEYFARMTTASERFGDSRTSGWRSDRGKAYVQLGPPDREVARAARRAGERDQLQWVYDSSLPIRVQLLFEDVSGFGTYTLTQRSRLLLRAAVEHLRSRRPDETEERPRFEDAPEDRGPGPPPRDGEAEGGV